MKIIVKITEKRKSIKKSGFFYTAKDRYDNFFMFNSDESLNNNHYYLVDIVKCKHWISDIITLDLQEFNIYSLTIKNNVLTFNGEPIKSNDIIIKRVNLQKVADINKKMEYLRKTKPNENMIIGYEKFLENYKRGLTIEKEAVNYLKNKA